MRISTLDPAHVADGYRQLMQGAIAHDNNDGCSAGGRAGIVSQ